jgi:hypothetical protein
VIDIHWYGPDHHQSDNGSLQRARQPRRQLAVTVLGNRAKELAEKRGVEPAGGALQSTISFPVATSTQTKKPPNSSIPNTIKDSSDSNRDQVQYRISLIAGLAVELKRLQNCDCAALIRGERMFLTR